MSLPPEMQKLVERLRQDVVTSELFVASTEPEQRLGFVLVTTHFDMGFADDLDGGKTWRLKPLHGDLSDCGVRIFSSLQQALKVQRYWNDQLTPEQKGPCTLQVRPRRYVVKQRIEIIQKLLKQLPEEE